MLRIISLFFLLIISQITKAETISATSSSTYNFSFSLSGWSYGPTTSIGGICSAYIEHIHDLYYPTTIYESGGISSNGLGCVRNTMYKKLVDGVYVSTGAIYSSTVVYPTKVATTIYSCSSGYTLSDSAGNADSSGTYCTKNSCQDLYQTTSMIDIPPRQTVTNACFDGCSATSMLGTWVCDSDTACSVRVQFDGNSCSGGVDYAANASSSDSGSDSDSDSDSPPCTGGSTTGTVNGETVTTCADDGTDSPPITDTSSSSTPTTSTSGAGSTVGSPDNTSGSTSSTVGGGTDGLGGDGYGEGGSAGSSGGTSGTDSGGTSGTDSGGTSGTDSGGTSGTDSGGTSGTDSGGTSGTDSGGTSGTDSGGTSGSSGGTDSGGTSGSGGGTDTGTGTGTATSGAGGTDSDTPAEEEEESGDGGGSFSAPGKGTDYLKDVFGESDLADLASDNAELTTKINQKMADVKSVFNLGVLSVTGDMPENKQEIKGASVDLSGRNVFEQFSIVAAAFYLCAIATAIYIVMGGKK